MRLRRAILAGIFIALGICGAAGLLAVYAPYEMIAPIVWSVLMLAVALGLIFPLTLLVERPKLRAAGIAAMGVLLLSSLFLGASIGLDGARFPGAWEYQQLAWQCLVLTLVMGIPAAGALLLLQFPWARLSAITFAGFTFASAVAIGVGLANSLSRTRWGSRGDSLIDVGSKMCLLGILVSVLMVNAGCGDRRWFRVPGIMGSILGFAILFGETLSSDTILGSVYDSFHPQTIEGFALALILAGSFLAHLNLVLMAGTKGALRWLRTATITTSSVLLFACFFGLVTGDIYYAWIVILALAVVIFCESLAIIGVSLLNRRVRLREIATITQMTHVDLTCPYCRRKATFPLGHSRCGGCGLQFSIQAIEPRCNECNYLLYGISSNRCPECGAPIDVAGGASAAGDARPTAVPEKQAEVSNLAVPGT